MSTSSGTLARDSQTYRWRDWFGYLALRVVIATIQCFSLERCDRICRLLGRILTNWIPIRGTLLASNLTKIFPEWTEEKRYETKLAMWHHLLLMCCEIAHASRKIHRENWYEHYYVPERTQLIRILFQNRPMVLVSGHFGNFELAGFLTGLFGIDSTSIARPLDNGYVHDYVMAFRSIGGQHFMSNDGTSGKIQELLESNGKIALLADQHGGEKGCWVDFLGKPASCHKALALFTLSSGAPMLVFANTRIGGPLRFELKLLGVADPNIPGEHLQSVASLTRWYNCRLESAILQNPQQYWWVHRRWREPPARVRRKAA